jgi:O-antigen ligase
MAKDNWPEVSPNLSHSHSGWLDVILALGFPGFAFILVALLLPMFQAKSTLQPWQSLIRWALLANAMLWITTEVAATVTFVALIFWICWSAGLTLPMAIKSDMRKL